MDIEFLREDWEVENLGDFAEYEKGKKPKRQKKDKTEKFKYPYINIEAFEKGIYSSYSDGENCRFCSSEDFLMVWDGSRSGLVGKGVDGALGSTLMRINFPGIENDYAYYFLQSKFQEINTRAKGTGTPHVDPNLLWGYNFPIPSLPEQRAIVSKIEELFSSLDSGIADLKNAQDQLKLYRQAVLSDLLPNEKIKISSLIKDLSQGWSPKCINSNSNNNDEWAVIKTSAIQPRKFVEFENKILPDNLDPREQHEIKNGDILITRAGPRVRVGVCCLVKNVRPKLINCDKVYRIKVNDKVIPEFFEYALNSPEVLRKIEKIKSGSNDSGLNLTQNAFKNLEIPFAIKNEQNSIVTRIENRLSICDALEKDISRGIEKAVTLKQGILKKAFEGDLLTEQEVKKCKQAADYEPASKLLERIKAEKV